MGRKRSDLHAILVSITPQVYFQPPNGLKMSYPCIVYERGTSPTSFADNRPYRLETRYTVTVIDSNPDSTLPDALRLLPLCTHDRFFAVDNLNHDVFNLYF